MLKTLSITAAALALGLTAGAASAAGAYDTKIIDYDFSFEGPFGKFDQNQLQRGLQVYTEVCSACHGLRYVPIRTLADEGGPHLPEDQVRAYAEPASRSMRTPRSQVAGSPWHRLFTAMTWNTQMAIPPSWTKSRRMSLPS